MTKVGNALQLFLTLCAKMDVGFKLTPEELAAPRPAMITIEFPDGSKFYMRAAPFEFVEPRDKTRMLLDPRELMCPPDGVTVK